MNALGRTGARLAALCMGLMCAMPAAADGAPWHRYQYEFWQLLASIPVGQNPVTDETGRDCGVGQRGNYWFLFGNFGGETTRSCTVPKGVILVVPLITSFCYPEEGFDDDASCLAYIVDAVAAFGPKDLIFRLDGKNQEIRQVCDVAVASGDDVSGVPASCKIRTRADRTLFNFWLPATNSVLPSTPGIWRANGANGFWGMIDTKNLSPGNHVVRIKTFGDFFQNVRYNLTIASPTN